MRNLLQRDYCLKYMNYKQGISRQQVSLMSIDCHISSDNPVRVIDMFVEQLDLGNLSLAEAMPVALAMGVIT